MIGHPAVENAALAATLGWDPHRYAKAEGIDRLFAEAVLARAAELHMQDMETSAKLLANEIIKILR